MRIKRVEIIGFKSFCDRAVIQISEAVTGVVGPNGCGKSNIVDAIRWCMGEQSAKHLRGKAMEDVIFAGSESRGPAPMAEVSLTFDDVGFSAQTLESAKQSDEAETERTLDSLTGEPTEAAEPEPQTTGQWFDAEGNPIASPLEEAQQIIQGEAPAFDFAHYTEVTITRRLYRDGVSQYFINKTPCRLRDITDFFLGTGVGTKAYAIIEQGRIGQIVSARPQDRRAIIEEAAGITKFKVKKKAAEKKLDQTRQNLMRVSDIVTELEKRMGTLRRQAQKAERYRKYKSEMKDIELWKGAHRFLELMVEGQLVGNRLVEARTERDESRALWTTKDAHVVSERSELAVEERRLLTVQEHLYELENRLRLGESKIGFERREAEELEARIASARSEIAGIESQRERAAVELATRAAELEALEAEVARETEDVAAREAVANEARQMMRNAQGELDEARAELGARRTEIATAETGLAQLDRRRGEAQSRLERVLGETETQQTRSKELERESRRVNEALATLRQTRLDLGSQSQGFEERREQLTKDVARGEAEVDRLRSELNRRQSRLTSLLEIQERYEGFARGTRAIMQRADELGENAVHGVVADVVRAPERFEVAVEAALGDRLGGVLVAEPAVGLAAVGFLKQGNAGRSAFVPVADRDAVVDGALVEGDGVLGAMAELVPFAEGYEAVGKRLLAGTVVVDGLERAVALHKQGTHSRLVTLEGDIVDADGVVAGGSREAQGAGVLAQKREIRDLEDIVGRLEHELSEATTQLMTAKAELKQVGLALDGIRKQAHEGELAIMGHEKDEARLRTDLERVRDRLGQLGTEQLELEDRMRQIAEDEVATRERRAAAEERIADLERAQLDLLARAASYREQLEDVQQHLTDARIRAAQLGEKRASAESATLRLRNADIELTNRATRLGREIDDAGQRAAALREACDGLAGELASVRETRDRELAALETGRAAYQARLGALTEVELAARDLRTRADRLATEVTGLELRDGQIKMTRQVVEDQVAERYQIDVRSVLHDFHLRAPISDVEEARLAELRELIDRMGSDINLTAIEEYAEVSGRFDFLSAQKTDLERAVDQLQKAIDKINKTSRKLFKDTFDSVNATFKQVFPRLFRGGQAALSLTGVTASAANSEGGEGAAPAPAGRKEVDLLEAGIEIMAQPPGKKNSTVEQLSGGEKALTAVALVFSIFLIKPSPFCILDEVDAPLDEANVDRYNEIVREMTDRSQFIVITHNKRTMESTDNLYGVTMKEPGVSMLVSVNLNKLGAKSSTSAPAQAAG